MRSPKCLLDSRVYSPENFRSAAQKDFCNKIGPNRTCREVCYLAALGGKADVSQRLMSATLDRDDDLISSDRAQVRARIA